MDRQIHRAPTTFLARLIKLIKSRKAYQSRDEFMTKPRHNTHSLQCIYKKIKHIFTRFALKKQT